MSRTCFVARLARRPSQTRAESLTRSRQPPGSRARRREGCCRGQASRAPRLTASSTCVAPQLALRRPRGCSRANPDDIKTPQQPRQASRPANRSPQTETSSSTVSISAGPFRVITARHNESASHVEPFASMHHQPRRRPHRQKTQRLTLIVGGSPPRYHAAVAPNRNEIRGHRRSRKKHLTVVPRHFILDYPRNSSKPCCRRTCSTRGLPTPPRRLEPSRLRGPFGPRE